MAPDVCDPAPARSAAVALLDALDDEHVGALVIIERHRRLVVVLASLGAELRLAAVGLEAIAAHRVDAVANRPQLLAAELLGVGLGDLAVADAADRLVAELRLLIVACRG